MLLVAGCGGAHSAKSERQQPSDVVSSAPWHTRVGAKPGSVTTRATTSTTVAALPSTWPTGPFPVRSLTETVSYGSPLRIVQVAVRYPATPGHYPLFVWMPGFEATPSYYESYLDSWAASGYVVASPTFPGTSGATSKAVFDDYVHQPADVRAVIDRMLADTATPGHVLDGLIVPTLIAVGGHSLGAVTAEGLTEESSCVDPRVAAAIRISYGDEPFPDSTTLNRQLPQLFIHGDHDETFPMADSLSAYRKASAPRFLVVLAGAGHTPFKTSASSTILAATTAFLDFTMKQRASALAVLTRLATSSNATG